GGFRMTTHCPQERDALLPQLTIRSLCQRLLAGKYRSRATHANLKRADCWTIWRESSQKKEWSRYLFPWTMLSAQESCRGITKTHLTVCSSRKRKRRISR